MSRRILVVAVALLPLGCEGTTETRVGSKLDTGSVLLGEMATQLVRDSGTPATHRQELGGTLVLWESLTAGHIDAYPEFTGTLRYDILKAPALDDLEQLRAALATHGVGTTRPLGFESNYAIGVRADTATRLGLRTISDLARHPDLRMRFSVEFAKRADCWPGLKRHYGLPQPDPDGIDHALAYRAIEAGKIDATDVYTTDAEIERFNLRVLEDDRRFFPRYEALYVYRLDWAARNPAALAALKRLEGRLDEKAVQRMIARTQDGVPEAATAAHYLRDALDVNVVPEIESPARKVLRHTGEHLFLSGVSLTAAVLVAVPLGVLAARRPRVGSVLIGFAGLVQTIPSLALLVVLVTVPHVGGLGSRSAIIALFLYSLLPIIRNTATGLTDIPPTLREAADGIGLTAWQKLRLVEFPLASRSILAGIKTAAVINIGTATLGALIDAGGLGVPIQQGLRTHDNGLILLGAIPSAALALLAEALFGLLGLIVVPRGLRLTPAR
ncbi:MAG TPA: glycine betaine ABC transporter substrate-binding protein [Gemmata sp.]|jgi:osmoprotectant transport system permease protein|nr:glycine betaine ABC transporter substrate-binding protein [Gemmata sp.]